MATLYDVAKLAGVSPKTVSRVFNESHLVSDETRRRVLEAVKALDYHPNAIASSLKRRRSNIIGFVVPYGSDFVFQDFNMLQQLRGVHEELIREGYEVILSVPLHKNDALNEAMRLIKHKNADGVILYPSAGVDAIISEFKAKGFSYVTLGVCFGEQKTNFVDVDMSRGGYLATKYLLSQGHRRIGLINKPSSFFMYDKGDLLAGYKAALAESEVEFAPELVRDGDFTFESGYREFMALRNANADVTAVICASDPMAYGAIRAAEDLGLTPGRDIEVVGGDNLPVTQKLFPYMSAISNPSYEQGRQAGKMIVSVLREGREQPGVMLETEFVVRGRVPRDQPRGHGSQG